MCTRPLYLAKRNKARETRPLEGSGVMPPQGIFLNSDLLRSFLAPFSDEIATVGRPTAESSHCRLEPLRWYSTLDFQGWQTWNPS